MQSSLINIKLLLLKVKALFRAVSNKGVTVNDLSSPIVIIGAGVAGLACALTLKRQGVPCLVLEKSDRVGGRIQTSLTSDNFRLDHGFQVLLTSYPELEHFLDLEDLQLQTFNSGALIYTPDKTRLLANPVLHPRYLLNEAFSDFLSLNDKALVVKLLLSLQRDTREKLSPVSTLSFLRNFGFSPHFIEIFWRPFCAGIFLDKKLDVDSEFFKFLMRHFATGRVAVPKFGMHKIPLQMSLKLGLDQIRFGVEVKHYSASEVVLSDGERIKARAVVCAFDRSETYHSVTNYYFATSDQLSWQKWLVLVPPSYGMNINNIAVMSEVSATYAPAGQSLVSVSLVGAEDPGEATVVQELKKIAGASLNFKFVHKFQIKKALPVLFSDEQVHTENGIHFCGDYLSSPSINGALKSGRLTAEKISAEVGM